MKENIIKKLLLFIVIGLIMGIGFYIFKILCFSNVDLETNIKILVILFLLFIFISFYLVRYYYPLLGTFCGNILLLIIPVIAIFYISKTFYSVIFDNTFSGDMILLSILLLMLIVLIVFLIIPLIKCIKDIFIGKQEIVLTHYTIKCEQYRRDWNYYIIKGTDKNNKKIELKSMRKVVKNDSEIKIKYYENIKMIESFEYLEKNS